ARARLQVALDAARTHVAAANRQLVAALRVQRALAKREGRWQAKAERAQLLSRQLDLQKTATLVGVREHAAAVRVDQLRGQLRQATEALTQARTQAQNMTTAPTAGALFATPVTNDAGYVSPVGGGPSVVSVSHHHHDYPAAD